jgi:polysaccharide export outer membrane protein
MLLVLGTSVDLLPAHAQSAPPNEAGQIQPGDLIRLVIWREPDWSGSWTVPVDGVVVFPRLGPRNVTGQRVEELRQTLLSEYAKYLVNPSIQFDVQRKVQVLGAVREPGVYTLDPTMTIMDALAMAGGVLPDGRQDRVELRRGGTVVHVLLDDAPLADSHIRSGDQLFVSERSFISRNASATVAMITGALGLLIAVAAR